MCWNETIKPSDTAGVAMLIPASSPTHKAPSIISRPPKEVRGMKAPRQLGAGEEGITIEDALGDNKGKINAWTPPGGKKDWERERRRREKENRDESNALR